jgi:A/G-specific adenine glycosylase
LKTELTAPAKALTRTLLHWYRDHRRDLPWRESRDPYRIWISEVMLQQTQAAVVIPYYRRFLKRFPSLRVLASAELPEVLELWSGLGYYDRARSLHAAAKAITALGGRFPSTLEGLRALPGFGPYTSAAVGSIAFDLPEPAIDGNAVRVYARLVGLRSPRPRAELELRELVRPLLQIGPSSDINQAIMDLGQLVCRVRSPLCSACPWRSACRARRDGTTDEIPTRLKARPRRKVVELAARITRGKTILLARRRERGLFGGLWELPAGPLSEDRPMRPATAPPMALHAVLRDLLRRDLGLKAVVGQELATIDRVLTHLNLRLIAFEAQAKGEPTANPRGRYLEARFVRFSELPQLALSSASRKLLTAVGVW